jgi:hypothetical protein
MAVEPCAVSIDTMRAECRLLLVADDELTIAELRAALGSELCLAEALGGAEPDAFQLRLDELRVDADAPVTVPSRYDLAVVALAGRGADELLARNHVLHERATALLAIVDDPGEGPPAWKRRSRSDRVLVRPFTELTLRAVVEQQLLLSLRATPAAIPDEAYLAFLGELLDHGHAAVSPEIGELHLAGFSYPTVASAFGLTIDAHNLLERLAELGLMRRRVAHRLRRCPSCSSHRLTMGEVCPACESTDYAYEPLPREAGIEAAAPRRRVRCRACGSSSPQPWLLARCLDCRQACLPERTRELVVHAYEPTDRAEEAVAAGRIAGFGLAAALRSQHVNLHSRSFFLSELAREAARFQSYGSPCSLLMVRLPEVERLRRQSSERFRAAVESAWQAVSGLLRKLDVACVWSEDILAALLPGSPADGARLVARRLEAQLAALPGLGVPVVATVSSGEGGADAMLRDALALVGVAIDTPEERFADDGVVVIEDGEEETVLDLNDVELREPAR